MRHLTADELHAGLDHIREAPSDDGVVELIVRRPTLGEREVLDEGELTLDEGLAGDTWKVRPSRRTADGTAHPDMQVTLVNARAIALLAQDRDRWALAGDQLYVDLDIGHANLPAGTQVSIGDAVVEITDQPHTGCAKFSGHFGADAVRFVNTDEGSALRLRGANARVITAGTVRLGDAVRKR
jgi:hypothetical protein